MLVRKIKDSETTSSHNKHETFKRLAPSRLTLVMLKEFELSSKFDIYDQIILSNEFQIVISERFCRDDPPKPYSKMTK